MCWAVPSVVVKVEGDVVYVDAGDGALRPAVVAIGEAVGPGDLVMVHAGVIIAKVDLETLRQSMEMWKQMAKELAAATGEDPEAAARTVEEEMWRVLKIAEEAARGKREELRQLA